MLDAILSIIIEWIIHLVLKISLLGWKWTAFLFSLFFLLMLILVLVSN